MVGLTPKGDVTLLTSCVSSLISLLLLLGFARCFVIEPAGDAWSSVAEMAQRRRRPADMRWAAADVWDGPDTDEWEEEQDRQGSDDAGISEDGVIEVDFHGNVCRTISVSATSASTINIAANDGISVTNQPRCALIAGTGRLVRRRPTAAANTRTVCASGERAGPRVSATSPAGNVSASYNTTGHGYEADEWITAAQGEVLKCLCIYHSANEKSTDL